MLRSRNRPASRRLNRIVYSHSIRMLPGYRRPPRPDYLAIACRLVAEAIRCHKRMAKMDPQLFDYAVIDQRRREYLEQVERDKLWRPAFEHVYGPGSYDRGQDSPSPEVLC